jgi:hypothetical protein
MTHKGTSPRTLDLFESTLTIPTPTSEPASASPKLPALSTLSDAQLAQQLGQLVYEVHRRVGKSKSQRPELEAAVRQASLSLQEISPGSQKQRRMPQSSKLSVEPSFR